MLCLALWGEDGQPVEWTVSLGKEDLDLGNFSHH